MRAIEAFYALALSNEEAARQPKRNAAAHRDY